MFKNKLFVIFIAAFLMNLNNISFAIENVTIKDKYPDYACEFCGKDKCETFNRRIFIFNSKVNKGIIRPVNIVWASIMPKYGMNKVQNFYTNMEYPIRLVSCLLQKDFKSSRSETARFFTNITLGVGGLYDPAKDRFKIEPRDEDMGQALAHLNVKKGPYLVLPIVASGNLRDLAGQLLNCPLNPTSYIIGPVALVAKSLAVVNKTTYLQSLVKAIDCTYADPYEITKKLQGVEKFIKNSNLDRSEVLAEKTASQNVIQINDVSDDLPISTGITTGLAAGLTDELRADIGLVDYKSQSPVVDCLRTAFFDDKTLTASKWSELSVWNKCFNKKIITSSVNIEKNRPNYQYRYILQKNKTAPLAIIYPSIGEGFMSHHSAVIAKLLYEQGYSVIIQGSAFQWEFVNSMPEGYRPGYPAKDAASLRLVTSKIISSLETKNNCKFDKKILIGTSFGAMTTLFAAAQEEKDNTLGISNYISINPPIEILFALKQVDKYSQDWKNNPDDIKMRAAIVAEKVLLVSQSRQATESESVPQDDSGVKETKVSNYKQRSLKRAWKTKTLDNTVVNDTDKSLKPCNSESLPFTDDEAKLIISFVMKQKLSDLVFTIENASKSKKTGIYDSINEMSFYDYAQKYLLIDNYVSNEQLNYDTSLYSIADFLQKSDKYKIYHAIDDYYVSPEQLVWLKKQSNNKAVFFDKGSHLGFMYRKEFIDALKKDVKISNATEDIVVEPNINDGTIRAYH